MPRTINAAVCYKGSVGTRFLVVDDDDGIRRLVATVLRRRQIDADEARDGREAIEKLSETSYAALVLDLMMPICTGHEVLAFLREQHIERKCVVIMTAAGTRGTRDLDLSLVHRVLHKPFELQDIVAAAEECAVDAL